VLIKIEVEYYETNFQKELMSEENNNTTPSKKIFWEEVTKYTECSTDNPFVNEIAYVMVTLHRTGA
jgi:hypothetical protein